MPSAFRHASASSPSLSCSRRSAHTSSAPPLAKAQAAASLKSSARSSSASRRAAAPLDASTRTPSDAASPDLAKHRAARSAMDSSPSDARQELVAARAPLAPLDRDREALVQGQVALVPARVPAFEKEVVAAGRRAVLVRVDAEEAHAGARYTDVASA